MAFLGLFKTEEEKEQEQQREKRAKETASIQSEEYNIMKAEERTYDLILSKVIITPENQNKYERRVGYSVELIDVILFTKNNIGVLFSPSGGLARFYDDSTHRKLRRHLVEAGIEAVVDAKYTDYHHRFYGLPVRRKNGGPYR